MFSATSNSSSLLNIDSSPQHTFEYGLLKFPCSHPRFTCNSQNGHNFRMALYKCCSFSDDSMEEDTEVFILGDNLRPGEEMQQPCFRSASVSTLSAKIDPSSSSMCQRNNSVPCDLSSLSTTSEVCLAGFGQSLSGLCNCSSPTTCKCEQTPVVFELTLSEACTNASPAPPSKAGSPPIKFSPSMTSTLSSAVLSKVLPIPSTLSAAAPAFLPRYQPQSNQMPAMRSGETYQNRFFHPPLFKFPEHAYTSNYPLVTTSSSATHSYPDNVFDTPGHHFVTMSELLQVFSLFIREGVIREKKRFFVKSLSINSHICRIESSLLITDGPDLSECLFLLTFELNTIHNVDIGQS